MLVKVRYEKRYWNVRVVGLSGRRVRCSVERFKFYVKFDFMVLFV